MLGAFDSMKNRVVGVAKATETMSESRHGGTNRMVGMGELESPTPTLSV